MDKKKAKTFTNAELKSLIRQYRSKNCKPFSKLNKKELIEYILKVKKIKEVYEKLQSKKNPEKKGQSQITEFYKESPKDPPKEEPKEEPEEEPKKESNKMSWRDALKKYAEEVNKYVIPKKGSAEYKRVKEIQNN
jgi:hypothetical protein